MKWRSIAVTTALLGGVGLLAALQFFSREHVFQGSVIEPSLAAQDFELTAADGQIFRLSDQRGFVVVMFFGYTHCPDFCPTTMADLKRLEQELGEEAGRLRVVFISVDPRRDSPEVTADYAHLFSPNFIGLSGTEDALAPIWRAFYVARADVEIGSDGDDYAVQHTTRVIVIDKSGNFRMTFPYGLGLDAMASDVRYLINE